MPKNSPKKCAPISEGDHFQRIFYPKNRFPVPKMAFNWRIFSYKQFFVDSDRHCPKTRNFRWEFWGKFAINPLLTIEEYWIFFGGHSNHYLSRVKISSHYLLPAGNGTRPINVKACATHFLRATLQMGLLWFIDKVYPFADCTNFSKMVWTCTQPDSRTWAQ